VYYKQATVLGRKGRLDQALVYLKRAAAKGQDPVIQEHLGDVYLCMGLLNEARTAWESALEMWKKRPKEPPGPDKVRRKLEDLKELKLRK